MGTYTQSGLNTPFIHESPSAGTKVFVVAISSSESAGSRGFATPADCGESTRNYEPIGSSTLGVKLPCKP